MFNIINQLDISELTCVRGDEAIFNGLNFRAEAHDVVQLQGRNGSGKTSLLRILCGLVRPEDGVVRWNDVDINDDATGLHNQLTYVGHRRGVCEDLSPLENLIFACDLTAPKSTERCRDALNQVGLGAVVDKATRLLSAGQNQRVALARLLVSEARLWCLDEPFTALDRDGRALVERIISSHATAGGISFVATHQPMTQAVGATKILDLDEH